MKIFMEIFNEKTVERKYLISELVKIEKFKEEEVLPFVLKATEHGLIHEIRTGLYRLGINEEN